MTNVRHKVGDRVVALSNSPGSTHQPRIKGNVYTVEKIQYCSKCGEQDVNLGYKIDFYKYSGNVECTCGNVYPGYGIYWTFSKHFAPISELPAYIAKAEQSEDYETAALLMEVLLQEVQLWKHYTTTYYLQPMLLR